MGVSTPTILAHEVTQGKFYNASASDCEQYKHRPVIYADCLSGNLPSGGIVESRPAGTGTSYLTNIATNVSDIPDKPKRDWGQTLQNVGSGLGALLSGFQTGQQSGGIFGGSPQSNQAFMMQQAEAERRRKRNTTIGIVVGVLAVGGIGYAIYKAK